VIRTRLTHHAPSDIGEACALLAARGEDAAVLGGGTWLVPLMSRGERSVTDVVDLRRLGLAGVAEQDGELGIGAMTTYADVLASSVLGERAPLLHAVARGITGGKQIHNLGTLGGSACFAFPSSDVPACLVALGARMRIDGPSGSREVAAADFFLDAFSCALERGEVLTAMVVPAGLDRVGYAKLKLCESSWPIATAAAVVTDGTASVTLGGVGRTPLRIDLDGAGPEQLDAMVGERLGDPWDDELAPADYRRAVAPVIARRALEQATKDGGR
jgi:CO/xanthine dehydrogenase FAD-binding subunit